MLCLCYRVNVEEEKDKWVMTWLIANSEAKNELFMKALLTARVNLIA